MVSIDLEKLFESKYQSKISSTRGRIDKQGNKIEMRLSLEEFKKLYLDAGVLPVQPYVISRINDLGHYEVGNVFINTNAQNSLEASNNPTAIETQITSYCHMYKYKRRVIKRALLRGTLTEKELFNMSPITRHK